MILENSKLFLQLYTRPQAAMSGIIDRGSWLYAAVAVAVVSVLFQLGVTSPIYKAFYPRSVVRLRPQIQPKAAPSEEGSEAEAATPPRSSPLMGVIGWRVVSFSPTSTLTSVFALALLYVPLAILLMVLFEHLGSFGVVFRRDYGALLACTLMAWGAAHLPFGLAGLALDAIKPNVFSALALWALSKVFFAVLMVFALRTVFGSGYTSAVGTVSLAWTSVLAESYLVFLASPFLLYWGYLYFRGDVSDVLSGFRTRQSFRRYLEASTVNPRDAEAHYQLGLIHQQRHQLTEAAARFRRAVEIDPNEVDARYQLGLIAHAQGHFEEALEHFQGVVARDADHAQSEIWRALGLTYTALAKDQEARVALEKYVERRSYDPEGLYYYGETLMKLGEGEKAREMFERCVEAEETNPYYRHGQVRKWRRLAEKKLRSLGA